MNGEGRIENSRPTNQLLASTVEEARRTNQDLSVLFLETNHTLVEDPMNASRGRGCIPLLGHDVYKAITIGGNLLAHLLPQFPTGLNIELSIGVSVLNKDSTSENPNSLGLRAKLAVDKAREIGGGKIGVYLRPGEELDLEKISPEFRDKVILVDK